MTRDDEAVKDTQAWDVDAVKAAKTVITMVLVIVIPAVVTLLTVDQKRPFVDTTVDPTPHGYTWSLLLFIIPVAALGAWFWARQAYNIPKRSFWWTVAILSPLGIGLDMLFAGLFFTFPNTTAVVGWKFPGYLPGEGFRVWIPIEEIVFYVFGFIFALILYLWLDEYWLRAYNRDDYPERSAKVDTIVRLNWTALVVGALLIVGGVVVKKLGPNPEGFPGFFTFLVVCSIAPAVLFFHTAVSFINWRAVSVALFVMVLVSMMWEATLGIPYEWWGFQQAQMLGFPIHAWSDLPVEEPLVWMMVTFLTVIIYEIVKIRLHMGRRSFWHSMFGRELPRLRRRKAS